MSDGVLTCVGLPDQPFSKPCKACRRPGLIVDVGLTVEGVPGSWIGCHKSRGGCGALTCGQGKHWVRKDSFQIWEDGITAGDGNRVFVCREDTCGVLYDQMLKDIAAFQFPEGHAARMAVARLTEQAKGSAASWIAIAARTLLRVWEFHTVEKPRLEKERNAALLADQARWAQAALEQAAARRAAEQANWSRARAAMPLDDPMLLPEGTDPEMVDRIKTFLACQEPEGSPGAPTFAGVFTASQGGAVR